MYAGWLCYRGKLTKVCHHFVGNGYVLRRRAYQSMPPGCATEGFTEVCLRFLTGTSCAAEEDSPRYAAKAVLLKEATGWSWGGVLI